MNGKKVGVTRGTIEIDLLKRWCKKKNVGFKVFEYATIPDKESELYSGKIDLDLEVSLQAKPDFSALEKIGSSAYYDGTDKSQSDGFVKDSETEFSGSLERI